MPTRSLRFVSEIMGLVLAVCIVALGFFLIRSNEKTIVESAKIRQEIHDALIKADARDDVKRAEIVRTIEALFARFQHDIPVNRDAASRNASDKNSPGSPEQSRRH